MIRIVIRRGSLEVVPQSVSSELDLIAREYELRSEEFRNTLLERAHSVNQQQNYPRISDFVDNAPPPRYTQEGRRVIGAESRVSRVFYSRDVGARIVTMNVRLQNVLYAPFEVSFTQEFLEDFLHLGSPGRRENWRITMASLEATARLIAFSEQRHFESTGVRPVVHEGTEIICEW